MKFQYETISYDLKEALEYLKRLLRQCRNKTLNEGEFLPEIEHILWHLNFSFNARYLSRKKVSKLSQKEHENLTLPPHEIFGSIKKNKKIKKIKNK